MKNKVSILSEGDYYIAKRLGKMEYPWGVYRLSGGQGIRVNAFKTEMHARIYAAAQMIAEGRGY